MFTSCRVDIGPIDNDNLLGNWMLCGHSSESGVVHKRCQPATIEYRQCLFVIYCIYAICLFSFITICSIKAKITFTENPQNPDANWPRTVNSKFNHPVHFGGSVNTGLRGSGPLLNCHIITPFGEDIVFNGEANYPYFNLNAASGDASVCGVLIGPIEAGFLGNWEIYATFQSAVFGFMEVRQPLTFFLYGKFYYNDQVALCKIGWRLLK